MNKLLLLFLFCLFFQKSHCVKIEKSTICKELTCFLINQNKISKKDTVGVDPSSLILLFNILYDESLELMSDFSIYGFNKVGLEDDIDYLLIKVNQTYAIFKSNDILTIFTYLTEKSKFYPLVVNEKRLVRNSNLRFNTLS